MTVRFFRIEIIGTDEAKLSSIKDWFDTKIEANDLSTLGWETYVGYHHKEDSTFVFTCRMFIKTSVQTDKYKDTLQNKWPTWDKTSLISAQIIQYDNCSHDSENPQPCNPDVRFGWSA